MASSLRISPVAISLALTGTVALCLACGGTAAPDPGTPAASPTANPAATPAGTVVAAPTASQAQATGEPRSVGPVPPVGAGDYDSLTTMYLLYSGPMHRIKATLDALLQVAVNRDVSQVRVIVELIYFLRNQQFRVEAAATLWKLTGQDFGSSRGAWPDWMEWLGERSSEYPPPDGYAAWKANLFSQIDPRFKEFLAPSEGLTHVDLTQVVWGGVRPDGIPDLQNAPAVAADEAEYLLPEDRVFGVSINGENRAYPLRILNPHEMANDVVGGEPIALAY